jgi:integrase/recombinase XerD
MLVNQRAFDLKEIFLQDCRFRNLSPATIKDYDWFLTDIQKKLGDWPTINRQQIKELVLLKSNSGCSPATVNHYIRAIKALFSFLCKEGYMENNALSGLSLVTMPDKIKAVLDPKNMSSLLSAVPENGFYDLRDKAMIMILWDTAMRLKELLNIKLGDVDLKSGTIKITGKGRKDRVVPMGLKAKRELIKYLNQRGENHSDYLFCTLTGFLVGQRNFRRSLTKYGKKAGLNVSPHLLRHSAATFLAKAEMPAPHLQALLGHASLAITQNYINRVASQEGLQISHRRLSPGDHI